MYVLTDWVGGTVRKIICSRSDGLTEYQIFSLPAQPNSFNKHFIVWLQRTKKVVPDSPGIVDFAIGLVNSVINLPDGQVNFSEEFKLQKNCEINLLIKTILGLVKMSFGLVNVSFSSPEWQAVKMTFFAPWTVVFFIFLMEQTSVNQHAFLTRLYAFFQPYLLMRTVLIQPFFHMVFQKKNNSGS